jgi:TRAP-type transport system periplasmic protein
MNRCLSRKHVIGTLGALGIAGPALPSGAADTYSMRLSVSVPPNSLEATAALRFASTVGRRSNGALKVEVFANGQLATQQETPEALATGVIDFAIQGTAFWTQLFPQYQVFDAPFLFKNLAAGVRVFDGPVGAELFALLEPKGIICLGWGTGGFRVLETTSKAVVAPDDLKGLRIRIQNGAVFVATFQALGAIPVTIDLSELYMALQQHVVDGQDLPIAAFVSAKYYTVVKHVALSNHVLAVEPLFGSKRKIEALPAALQKIIREEGKAVAPFMRALAEQQSLAAVRFLKQNGIGVTEIQYSVFRKAVDPVYALIQSKLGGDLLDRVSRAANAA